MDGEIAPEDVRRALEENEDAPLIVDIRSPAAFKQGHIPGSRNVPFGDLPQHAESLADADHVVTVCPHGKASVQAAQLLSSYEGLAEARIDSMAGGLTEWPGEFETDATDQTGEDAPASDAPF